MRHPRQRLLEPIWILSPMWCFTEMRWKLPTMPRFNTENASRIVQKVAV